MTANTIQLFMQDLIKYIDDRFAKDERISSSKKLNGCLAFNDRLIENATKSFYVVQCLSNSTKDETFNSSLTKQISIQIDIFAIKGTFNKVQYLAEPMSIVLQDVVSQYMTDLKFGNYNNNICLMREITASPALSYRDGSKAYTASLRYDFTIMTDYSPVI